MIDIRAQGHHHLTCLTVEGAPAVMGGAGGGAACGVG